MGAWGCGGGVGCGVWSWWKESEGLVGRALVLHRSRHAAEGARVPASGKEEAFRLDLVASGDICRRGFGALCRPSSPPGPVWAADTGRNFDNL